MSKLIPIERIQNKIYLIRGRKVMIDRDLAKLYGVPTMRLNEQVRRNIKRFPSDFMFQLNKEEFDNWKSQFAISNSIKMGLRKKPYAFTEQGVSMLSGVLYSNRAIEVNIAIMRVFVKIRQVLATHKDLAHKLNDMERKVQRHDMEIKAVFQAIRQLMEPPKSKKKKIGF